jgi:hypothetical protein
MRAKVEVGGCCDPHRDELFKHLNAHGVQTVVNYPIALPFVEAHGPFKHWPEQFPNAYADKKKLCCCRCLRRSPATSKPT